MKNASKKTWSKETVVRTFEQFACGTEDSRRTRILSRVAVMLCLLMLGCATAPPQSALISQESSPQYAATPQNTVSSPGSLWNSRGPFGNLFVSNKAQQVGDIVTIKIVETSSASNNAATNTGRSSAISGGLESFFGLEQDHSPTDDFFNPFGKIQAGMESTFDGAGTTTRSGKLNAYMTARITETLPNGDYRIVGSREVTVNNDKQIMILSGVIRAEDILADNIVLSTYIADAKIVYNGSGVIADRQQPGWLGRVLDTVWPF